MTISNCGHDENNRYSGGTAGDQSGTEWYLRSWYSCPWNYAIWHPDQKVNDLVAQLAIEAAQNDLVGYDQNQRTTFWTHLAASNYRPSQITVACEADCSSGVLSIVKAVGYLLGMSALQNVNINGYTGNEKSILESAGFVAHSDSKYLTTDAYLPKGAILLNTSHHTTINVTQGSSYSGSSSSSSSSSSGSSSSGQLEVDGQWGPATTRAMQKALGTYCDGIVSQQYSAYKSANPGLRPSSWEWVSNPKGGSNMVKALQKKVGSSADGFIGPNTIRALQRYVGTEVDGYISNASMCVKAVQRKLNSGSF